MDNIYHKKLVEECIKVLSLHVYQRTIPALQWAFKENASGKNNFPVAQKQYKCAICGNKIQKHTICGVFYATDPKDSNYQKYTRLCVNCSRILTLQVMLKLRDTPRNLEYRVGKLAQKRRVIWPFFLSHFFGIRKVMQHL